MPDKNAIAGAPPAYDGVAAQHGAGPLPVRAPSGKPLRVFPLEIPVLSLLKGKRIILASASPRRKQLLAQVGSQGYSCYQKIQQD